MNLLAIDTSSVACSVALSLGDQIYERHAEQAREHTQLLVPMIEQLLKEGAASLADLDAFVLGNGPGSFIGMRISASLVQGMAFGVSKPVIPVSSMLAVAEAVFDERDCDEVIVAQDAHMNEVYLGRYTRAPNGAVTPRIEEQLHEQARISALGDDIERVAAGGILTCWRPTNRCCPKSQDSCIHQPDTCSRPRPGASITAGRLIRLTSAQATCATWLLRRPDGRNAPVI